MPYINDLLNLKLDPTNVSSSIQNALITNKQKLTPSYRYIQGYYYEKYDTCHMTPMK